MSAPAREQRPDYLLHLGLFLATCLTTTWAGAVFARPETLSLYSLLKGLLLAQIGAEELRRTLGALSAGLPFSLSMIAILACHEMGHYVLARRHGVAASLPYFLPLPFGLIGTLGAVIRMPAAVRDRNALVDIGAAGPLAGLAVCLPLLAYGIRLSPIKPTGPGMLEGNSLLYLAVKYVVTGRILPGGGLDVQLHPVAWAGWVGLLVTMINLIPIGQLDGGHIAFAYFGGRHDRASRWLHRALLPLGLFAGAYTALELSSKASWGVALALGAPSGAPWIVWWLLLTLMRRLSGGQYHPPVEEEPLTPGRRRLCRLMALLFVALVTPIPLRPTLASK